MGRAGLLYAELSRADALARHLAHLAAMGKSSAALRGTISAVRMAKKLQLLRPTVGPIHWAIAAGAGRAYNCEPGQQVWGTLGMLRAMATAVRTDTDLAVLALTSSVPVTVCGSERLPVSAGLMSASRAGSVSTTARPSGASSPPGWGPGRSAGDRPCWRAASCSAGPSSCPSSPRQSSSAACTAYCGERHGSGSAGTVGGDSRQRPWSRWEPLSPPCASGIDGHRSGRHGSTRCRDPTGSSSSRTRPPGHTRSRVSPRCLCPPSSSGLPAPSGGAQPPMLQAPLLSSWSTVMTRGTTPTMGYWEPLARIVEWPRKDGNNVRDIRAASNRRRRPRVRVRLRLRKPKARRFSSDATSVSHA